MLVGRLQAAMPDSLQAALRGLPDSSQVQELIARSVAEMYRDPVVAGRYLDWADSIAARPALADWQAQVVKQRGTLHWVVGDHKSALAAYQEAERRFTAQGDALGAARAQNNIGLVYQDMGYYDLSLRAYLRSAAYFEHSPERHALATLYNNIGNVCNGNQDHETALVYYDKSLALFTEAHDSNGCAMIHNNVGLILGGRRQWAQAGRHFQTALDLYRALDYPVGECKVLTNLAGLQVQQGRFEEAESLARKALQLAEGKGIPGEVAISELKLAEIYLKWGRHAEAIDMAEACLRTKEAGQSLTISAGAHEVLAAAHERMGRFDQAFAHLKAFETLHDSIFSLEKTRVMEEMKLQFGLALKDKEVENYAQRQRIDRLTKWGLGVVILLLLVAGGLVFARQRAIIRREQALQAKDKAMHAAQHALSAAELKAAEAELKATESERLRLKGELDFKGREISGLAMNIVRQNDLLEVLDRELKALRKGADEQKLRELSILVSQTLSLEHERKELQLYIQEAQQNFFLRLEAGFPDLSTKEKRLCAMIRMGLSSKEIAAVLNIEIASVEVARHRLRKKLGLAPSDGLKEFLDGF